MEQYPEEEEVEDVKIEDVVSLEDSFQVQWWGGG